MAVEHVSELFMRDVKKSARLRAPKDTGELREFISLTRPVLKGNIKKWTLTADAPHSFFQEEGFRPHWAPILNSAKLSPGTYFVSKHTPFMAPALEHNLSKFSQRLARGMDRGLRI